MKNLLPFLLIFLCIACSTKDETPTKKSITTYTKVSFYKYPYSPTDKPFKYKLDYYFEDGTPHRWIELDSTRKVTTEYIYDYNGKGKHIGAKYREEGELDYSIERVRYKNDTIKVTEWLDSLGKPYYWMTDYLNTDGNTYRAQFKGEKVHGYDSTFYTVEGFEKRIFFTNMKGKVFNDRSFVYDSVNDQNEWIVRKKIMNDTIQEVQIKEVYTDNQFTNADGTFYESIISTERWSENTFSFTEDENTLFLTRTSDWEHQFGVMHTKEDGLFTTSDRIAELDTIYNGAISPSGSKIIYCGTKANAGHIYLIEKNGDQWSAPINLTATSNIQGGYFYWLTETDLFFYTKEQNGNIVQGTLIDHQLKITDSLLALNTEVGTEFSPYVDQKKQFIIFTRYLEKDLSQQGFFISYNKGTDADPTWSTPKKIETLPYGWNAYFINDGSQFLYTDGENIKSVPTATLNLTYAN